MPCASAKTWISTCRGRSISRSTYSVPSPNAAAASRRAAAIASGASPSLAHDAHALAAAAGRGLDQHGIARRARARREHAVVGLIARRLARHDRHAGRLHQRARADLRSHALDDVGRRADEDQPRVLAGLREARRSRRGTRSPGWTASAPVDARRVDDARRWRGSSRRAAPGRCAPRDRRPARAARRASASE